MKNITITITPAEAEALEAAVDYLEVFDGDDDTATAAREAATPAIERIKRKLAEQNDPKPEQ